MTDEYSLSDDLEQLIAIAYGLSGNEMGWRFLYAPREVLEGSHVAFIGLNPGGRHGDPAHAEFSMNSGSAYRDEVWPSSSRLQHQVLSLFRRLNVAPERVLAGNLVPFRSPDWKSLNNRGAALKFGCALWKRVLARSRPTTVVSMGGVANDAVSALLGVQSVTRHLTGWGNCRASRGTFDGGTWIGLPHLSRFAIMDRPESEAAINELFEGVV